MILPSGKSSDSFVSSSSGDKAAAIKLRDDDSPGAFEARYPNILFYSRSSTPSIKGVRLVSHSQCQLV